MGWYKDLNLYIINPNVKFNPLHQQPETGEPSRHGVNPFRQLNLALFFPRSYGFPTMKTKKKTTCGEPPKKESPRHGYGSIPIHTIFSGMNIHLPAILGFTRGTRVLTHSHIASSWLFLAKPLHFATGAWCHVMEPADVAGHNWEGASSRAGGRPWHPLWKVMVVDPQKHHDL